MSFPTLGFGVGLRAEHYDAILNGPRRVDWFEAISENYFDTHGRPLATLETVRRDYPVALHGVALSIGSTDPIDRAYLAQLRRLIDIIQPALVTDHLCWTGVTGRPLYDLLPLPHTDEALQHVVARIAQVQEVLGCRIALENPSSYITYRDSTMSESEFLIAVAETADCGILLDVNNVYVTARNHGFDPIAYLNAVPPARVAQLHLAGFTDMGSYLFDTHSAPVHDDVWELYRHAVARFGSGSTLVEWDADIPEFARVCAESDHARAIAQEINDRTTRPSPRAA
jgi:uncharacterized protein (UPF0276 family)